MRAVAFTLIISALAAGFSFAADTQDGKSQPGLQHQMFSVPSSPFTTGKYSKMLNDMVSGALNTDITNDQKQKVSELRKEYVMPMAKEENDIRQVQMDILKMLEDPSFDPAQVKKEIENVNAASKKVSDRYIDGLASLRDTVGKENYKTLSASLSKYQQNLVQMRKHSKYQSMQSPDTRETTSGQTSRPGTETQDAGN